MSDKTAGDTEPRATYSLAMIGTEAHIQLGGVLFFRDFPVANEIVETLDAALEQPGETPATAIVLDFAKVEWMDSHWLGFMVRVLHHGQKVGLPVRVVNTNATVRRLFTIVNFQQLFDLEPRPEA